MKISYHPFPLYALIYNTKLFIYREKIQPVFVGSAISWILSVFSLRLMTNFKWWLFLSISMTLLWSISATDMSFTKQMWSSSLKTWKFTTWFQFDILTVNGFPKENLWVLSWHRSACKLTASLQFCLLPELFPDSALVLTKLHFILQNYLISLIFSVVKIRLEFSYLVNSNVLFHQIYKVSKASIEMKVR